MPATETCVMIDGGRIRAGDLAPSVAAFRALPADQDLAAAPAGTLVRTFFQSQLRALLPGVEAELPDRICVQRKRDAIPPETWQSAVETAIDRICPETPWKATVKEAPQHRFPTGEITLTRAGVVASRGSLQMWRGSLLLPDKSSIPIWVRVEIQTKRSATILQRALVAGAVLTPDDFSQEERWAPGLCIEPQEPLIPAGLTAKRSMQAGSELRKEDLRRSPAVHRGQPMEVEAEAGGARLRIPAVSEQDGDVGEIVRLRSTWNGSRLTGRVTGTQKARVE